MQDIDEKKPIFSDLRKAEYEDLKLVDNLRKENSEAYGALNLVLRKIHKISKEFNESRFVELYAYCERLLESLEATEEMHSKEAYDVLKRFHSMINSYDLSKEKIKQFIKKHSAFFKTKPNKRLKKKIEKILKRRLEKVPVGEKGPTITAQEIAQVKNRLKQYFDSGEFLNFIKFYNLDKIKVNISLFGSLVTGRASKYSKYIGMPSDYERISDVDMGIVIDNAALKNIKLKGRCLFKAGQYYGPFYNKNAEKMGPFLKIFEFVDDLSFAKKTNRKIGFVVVDDDFYKSNLKKEAHIVLFEKIINLN